MRGNPLLRAGLLLAALCLVGVLVAAVAGKARRPDPVQDSAPPPPAPTLVSTLLTITLSAPANALTFTEPSGRTIAVPLRDGLSLEHEADLAVTDHSWTALLTVDWQDPSRHNFLRLDFEPLHLKSTSLTLDFRRNATERPITTSFDPN